MTYVWVLVVLVVEVKSLIINGTGENCGTKKCGYGTSCMSGTCKCVPRFGNKLTVMDQRPNVKYCLEMCEENDSSGNCPVGTFCRDIRATYRCDCITGYMRSYLGQCIETTDKTNAKDDTTKVITTTTTATTQWHPSAPKTESVTLYVGLGVGIAGFILLVALLGILIFVIRKRKRSRKEPGHTGILNNQKPVQANVRGEGVSHRYEFPVDLSDESKLHSYERVQENPTASIPGSRVTRGIPAAYEEVDIGRIHALGESFVIPERETHISSLHDTGMMACKTQSDVQDSNPYNALYDLKPISANQNGEITKYDEVAKCKVNDADESRIENLYSSVKPKEGAAGDGPKMEAQTITCGENDYDELKLKILLNNRKSLN